MPTAFAPELIERTPTLRLRSTAAREDAPPILVAGADPAQRAVVLHELRHTLRERTEFEEASALWEVLARAPSVRMVILSDLDEVSAESAVEVLGRRHPDLPVVRLRTAAPEGLSAANASE